MHPDRPPVVYDPLFKPSADDNLQIFCYEGKPKYVIYLWQSVSLQIDLSSDNYVQYDGFTPEDVRKEYLAHRRSWSLNLFSWKQKHFKLNPFNKSCIGIDSNEKYTVYLNVIRIDYWKICSLILGVILFISGSKLSQNTIFYYLSGILFGVCASFLILIYFISKLLPKKPLMYGALIGGWTVGVYVLQILFENIRLIMTSYQSYVTCLRNQSRPYLTIPTAKRFERNLDVITPIMSHPLPKFASFIEGTSHLSDDEILEYEASIHNTELTDDEDENALTDEEY
ncbi:hypothetical protein MML48_6g00006056 [Holotrichia oblita]|uniref:Uncharacterized protein n=1 Tax=Holotrichia oblita TaxID=644536 RepID=A0ACB9SYG6_HOLOL|nr:hypothetical protein MML48_6g00006056 [Holotrichia oblita]